MNSFHCRPTGAWVSENFDATRIRDKRLALRLRIMATAMANQPGRSIPTLFPRVSAMEAAYNFMSNDKTDWDNVQHDHRQMTRERLTNLEGQPLLIQDTSSLSWTRQADVDGLGPVSSVSNQTQGFFLHTTLAVEVPAHCREEDEQPHRIVGLAHQQFHVRPADRLGNGVRGRDRSKSSVVGERLESEKWLEGIEPLPGAQQWRRAPIVVCDREADTWEMLSLCRKKGYGFCVRAAQDRVISGSDVKLMERVRSQPQTGTFTLPLRARPGKAARTAHMRMSVCNDVELRSPQRPGHKAGHGASLRIGCVRVWEEEGEGLEWILLVSKADVRADDALHWIRIYRYRWLIEEYHKCLKTGMGAEELQLETGKRLMTAVAIMAVIALRLLALRETSRMWPGNPAKESGLEEIELEVLSACSPLKRTLETVHDVVLAIGRLGGHLGRKNDGPPGWITLWRGMSQLKLLTTGYQLAKNLKR